MGSSAIDNVCRPGDGVFEYKERNVDEEGRKDYIVSYQRISVLVECGEMYV